MKDLSNFMQKEKLEDEKRIDISEDMKEYYDSLGFKRVFKRIKGMSFSCKIREIGYELKYAFQRFWRGYEDVDVWAMDDQLKNRLIVLLQRYKETKHCLWWCPEGYDWSRVCEKDKWMGRYSFSSEQMDSIIDTWIFHLKMSDEDYVEKKLYGKNVYDDDYEVGCRSKEEIDRIWEVRKQNQDAAMKLLWLMIDELWD